MPGPPVAAASLSASEPAPAQRPAAPIYLDNLATTPLDPRVLEAMLPFFGERFGNPSSRTHDHGLQAAAAVDAARAQVAGLVGATAREIHFTSGATEANNLALQGVVRAARAAGERTPLLITCVTEHRAVLDVCALLERDGCRVVRVPVDGDGRIDLDALDAALARDALLLSVMAANNETGVLQPLDEIAERLRGCRTLWHCDAAQAAGKIPIDLRRLPVDLLSLSAHKIHGPMGQGALYVRRRRPPVPLAPLQAGGGQERGLRPGTLNVPAIVGFGRACELSVAEGAADAARLAGLRDLLQRRLRDALGDDLLVNGHATQRLPNALNVSFRGVDGAALLVALRDLSLSSGSACSSGATTPSHVLTAMGRDAATASASLRFGFGRFTADEDVDTAARRVLAEVKACGI